MPLAVALSLTLGCGDASPTSSSGRPPSELESKIEKLRRDARREPDSLDVLQARLDTLWDWASARAIDGRTLPRDLARLVRKHALALDAQRAATEPDAEVLESTRSFIFWPALSACTLRLPAALVTSAVVVKLMLLSVELRVMLPAALFSVD